MVLSFSYDTRIIKPKKVSIMKYSVEVNNHIDRFILSVAALKEFVLRLNFSLWLGTNKYWGFYSGSVVLNILINDLSNTKIPFLQLSCNET